MRKKVLFAMFVLALFSSVSFADDSLTFNGELKVNGKEISGNGSIPMPKPKAVWTQDDDPGVMAGIFEEEGYDKEKPALTIGTSEAFSVSGSRVNGVFAIQSGRLESIGGDEAPYKVPAEAGDYYIGINNTPEEEEAQEDAAMLQYVKISVSESDGSPAGTNNNSKKTAKTAKKEEERFFNENTALILAAVDGRNNEVRALLEDGSDVNAKNMYGMTALMYAAEGNHAETVVILLEAGADINARNNEGSTALMIAAIHACEDAANALMENSEVDVEATNNNGKTALDYARENKNFKNSAAFKRLEELSE